MTSRQIFILPIIYFECFNQLCHSVKSAGRRLSYRTFETGIFDPKTSALTEKIWIDKFLHSWKHASTIPVDAEGNGYTASFWRFAYRTSCLRSKKPAPRRSSQIYLNFFGGLLYAGARGIMKHTRTDGRKRKVDDQCAASGIRLHIWRFVFISQCVVSSNKKQHSGRVGL